MAVTVMPGYEISGFTVAEVSKHHQVWNFVPASPGASIIDPGMLGTGACLDLVHHHHRPPFW
jgi:hypothetical protein